MSIWVKVCANTSLADAQLAVEAGADAVGFVFAPSPRRVTAEQVAAITPHLPASIEKFGVFVDADFETIFATVEVCGLTGVQLHSRTGSEMAAQLRARFGADLRILKVMHFDNALLESFNAIATDFALSGILIDSRTATAVGGTGIAFDWQVASRGVFAERRSLKLIVAGGLTPANVAEAIDTLKPWGVDVASGVEASPGCKDPDKVAAFVAAVRRSTTSNSASTV